VRLKLGSGEETKGDFPRSDQDNNVILLQRQGRNQLTGAAPRDILLARKPLVYPTPSIASTDTHHFHLHCLSKADVGRFTQYVSVACVAWLASLPLMHVKSGIDKQNNKSKSRNDKTRKYQDKQISRPKDEYV
jgi:hypothetical protein